MLAHLYSNLGRREEALTHARRARAPVSPLVGALEGQFLGHQGEHDAAIQQLNDVLVLEPRFWLGHHLLANALIDGGRYDEALAASAEAKRLSPLQTYSDTFDALSLVGLGRQAEARAILATLTERGRERYVPPTHPALIHAALGEHDADIEQLEAALAARDARLVFLKIGPKWNPLRGDSRFTDLMHRVGF
jgi:tetratricopeptide (TPR) repeat protein